MADAASKATTRNDSRRTGTSIAALADSDEVTNANDGRGFLEHRLLLCPPNEEFTLASLISCLHQVSRMGGITKTVAAAVLAVTFLAEELEEISINVFVRDAVNSQLSELTNEVQSLVEDAKTKVGQLIGGIDTTARAAAATRDEPRGRSYAEALVNPPSHANPRLAAREGIRARQFMLEGPQRESRLGQMNSEQLKSEFNKVLGELGQTNNKLRSAVIQRNRGILIEMENNEGAAWMGKADNRAALCEAIGGNAAFKARTYSLIAFNVALTVEPGDAAHRGEIEEANFIEKGGITAMRWAKLPERRSAGQRTAHLILSLENPNVANRAISEGLVICNRKVHVEKTKRDPVRCLKCQGWNHFAKECIITGDRCGNCAEAHRTDQCPTPGQYKCVSCESNTHASWSKDCPTYHKKLEENNRRNPENSLQFIPTDEPWTWIARPEIALADHRQEQRMPRHAGSRPTPPSLPPPPRTRPPVDNGWGSFVPLGQRPTVAAADRPMPIDTTQSAPSSQSDIYV
jgi:hypothetical protein